MQNRIIIPIIVYSLVLCGCANIKSFIDNRVTIITREVSKEIYIYQYVSATKTPTIKPTNTLVHITATPSCLDTARTQRELNDCAWLLANSKKEELHQIVNKVADEYSDNPIKKEEFLKIELEWEKTAERECWIVWGSLDEKGIYYEHGSMAPQLVGMCTEEKYKQRIKELREYL